MAKRRRKVRKGGLSGRARKVSRAPARCRMALSRCMTGTRSRTKKAACMRSFNRCIR